MRDDLAFRLTGVTKDYRLYPGMVPMALDLFGISGALPWMRKKRDSYPVFHALKHLDLEVKRGARLGVVGRNGSGKTTLLKLLTGNFPPTTGKVEVAGEVHSLMSTGLGFNNELTGYQNIEASMLYNNLSKKELAHAIADVVDFVELGDFLHQPLRTYSLGMGARLGFATATAIKPDILLIDEVLSAGDGYFAAKSAERVKKLTGAGTTLLLVSHSWAQILQFCEEAVWLDMGQFVKRGPALDIVRAYEAYLRQVDNDRLQPKNEEFFAKRAQQVEVAAEGRWPGAGQLRVVNARTLDGKGQPSTSLQSGSPMTVEIDYVATATGKFPVRFHVYVYRIDGVGVSMHLSAPETLDLREGDRGSVRLHFDSLLYNGGEYVMTLGLYESIDMADTSTARTYDLVSWATRFQVRGAFPLDESLVLHPARWRMPDGRELDDFSQSVQRPKSFTSAPLDLFERGPSP